MFPDSRDSLFGPCKPYWAYWAELTKGEVYEGLLLDGWFSDKLPPVFSAEKFLAYCRERKRANGEPASDWVRFKYLRNNGLYREYDIPSPFSYERLVNGISDDWDGFTEQIKLNTKEFPYAVSRIHPRKIQDSHAIFQMNYSNWQIDADPEPAILLGRKYLVKCDISACFPSIYTHSLPWAVIGIDEAKRNRSNRSDIWINQIDYLLQRVCNGETHGLLIGPHASNVVSELLLTKIDAALFRQGFRFVRHIDDYDCYVDNRPDAEKFVLKLQEELSKYRLTLNQKKTEIIQLPIALSTDWVRLLKIHAPEDSTLLGYSEVSSFLEYATSLLPDYQDNASILLYALRVLSGHPLKPSARKYVQYYAMHLACIYPYLLPTFEETVIVPLKLSTGALALFSNYIFLDCFNHADYLSACFALYYAIKYDFQLDVPEFEEIEEADDCLLYLFLYLYAKHFKDDCLMERLKDLASGFSQSGRAFEENWLFLYHIRDKNDLPDGEWRALWHKGVNFIKPEFLG